MRYWVLLFLISNTVFCQNKEINDLFEKYYNSENQDSSFYYIRKAYHLSKANGLDSLVARSALNIGQHYLIEGDFYQASKYTSIAYNYAKNVNFIKIKILALNRFGTIERENSNFNTSIRYYNQALQLNKKDKIIDLDVEIINNIAILYTLQKDSAKALHYYNLNIENIPKIENITTKINTYNSLASFLTDTNGKEAEKNFIRAYTLAKSSNDQFNLCINLSSLYLSKNLKNLSKSFYYLNQATRIYQQLKDPSLLFYLNFNYGAYYKNANDFKKAILFYNKALQIKNAPIYQKTELYQSLSQVYSLDKNFQQALEYKTKYHLVNDSLLSLEHKKDFAEIQTKYEVETKNNKIKLLTKEKTIQENNKIIIATTAFGIILFLILVFLVYYFKHKNQRLRDHQEKLNLIKQQEIEHIKGLIEGQNEERNRISKDLHDGVASTLATINRKLGIFNDNQDTELLQVQNVISQVYNEIRTISHNLSSTLIQDHTLDELLFILKTEWNKTGSFIVEIVIFPSQKMDYLNYSQKENIYRIIQELVTNISKYALAKTVYINCTYADNQLNIVIEDDGKNGFNHDKAQLGIGLKNIMERLTFLNGTLEIDSNSNGTTLLLNIPIP